MRKVLIHRSETWPIKVGDMQRMTRTERCMIRRMCGVSLKNRRRSAGLLKLVGISGVEEIMDSSALRWLGHMERKEELDWVSLCRGIEVEGVVRRVRKMNTWGGRMDRLMKNRDLHVEMAADRDAWREGGARRQPTRLGLRTRGGRVENDSGFWFSFCSMSDLCAHGQSLLIWVFFEDPQGELTRNAYDDDATKQAENIHSQHS